MAVTKASGNLGNIILHEIKPQQQQMIMTNNNCNNSVCVSNDESINQNNYYGTAEANTLNPYMQNNKAGMVSTNGYYGPTKRKLYFSAGMYKYFIFNKIL